MSYANVPSAPSGFFTSHLSLLRGWFFRGLPYLDLTTPRATYVMRSILAAWLALVVAYWLDLRAPYAAASSVLLVINPVQGAVIGKGAWRIADANQQADAQGLPSVAPSFSWVRLAQRIPVRVEFGQLPQNLVLAAGMTGSIEVTAPGGDRPPQGRLATLLQRWL